jgi:hypothetical protein
MNTKIAPITTNPIQAYSGGNSIVALHPDGCPNPTI